MNDTRRQFLKSSGLATAGFLFAAHPTLGAKLPTSDPATDLGIAWTATLKWDNVVDITAVDGGGKYYDERLAKAQKMLAEIGGGTIYFPAGEYPFENFIALGNGIILRGVTIKGNAKDDSYRPPSKLSFPKYEPSFKGRGTPVDTAFKGIILANPESAANCGVIDLAIDRGHIHFSESEEHKCGTNRIVFGCVLTNAAVADPNIPTSKKIKQPAWQRFTSRHHAAIDIKSSENLLVANNRLPKSGQDNFTQKGFIMEATRGGGEARFDVVFDYDNRPGLYVNHYCIGGSGGSGNDGTPKSHPYGFRKGTIIRDNYVHNSGRMGIGFSGDGVLCVNNTICFEKDIFRPTTTGLKATTGSATNDNRAIETRGWNWVVDGNDYDVDRNICSDRSYRINDGEGIMHEDHCNSDLRGSRLTNNKGNSYLSIYKCGNIDDFLIEGNDISTPGDIADIYVNANRNSGPQPCQNVTIQNNITRSNGIMIAGAPAKNNVIKNNEHKGGGGKITNDANAKLEGNKGYS